MTVLAGFGLGLITGIFTVGFLVTLAYRMAKIHNQEED